MPALVVVAIIVIAGASIFSQSLPESGQSVEPTTSPEPTSEILITSAPSPTSSEQPTKQPSPTPTKAPSPTSPPISINVNGWQYPGSKKLDNDLYESEADVNTITDWYENRIRENGYNTKSFVKTSTNGVINNKLVAASSEKNITVTITKDPNSSVVKIIISHTK